MDTVTSRVFVFVYNGSYFQRWIVDLHEKLEVGVSVFSHVAVEGVDVCLV